MPKPHVLIVDDEKSIRLALETGLSLDGFSVSSARSGREAISAARAQKFDVVVRTSFKAGHIGGQTDVWRNLFAGGALFYIFEWNRHNHRERRKLFSFSGGWRLTPRWITQYGYFSSHSSTFGGSAPSHILMFRYEFGRREEE